jgi:hypothetical protein
MSGTDVGFSREGGLDLLVGLRRVKVRCNDRRTLDRYAGAMIVMRRFLATFLGVALVLPAVGGARAQDYPNRIVMLGFSPMPAMALTVEIGHL